jgi:AAA15 family ATPase/GTPase
MSLAKIAKKLAGGVVLVEFRVTNFRSIRELQTLSMVAATGKEHRGTNVFDSEAPATPELLRSAVIYGPNAAGKSNLILALRFVHDFVLNSASKGQKGDAIPVVPFLMDADSADAPSEFELIFVERGVRYQYGFALTRQRVEAEWLIAHPKGSPQRWFDRKSGADDWSFGSNFRGQRKIWQETTRDNALFLSTAVQLNAEQLNPVFDWFRNRLRLINPYARVMPDFSISQCESNPGVQKQIIDFLAMADLGIGDVKVDRRKFDPSMLSEDIPEAFRQQFLKDMADQEFADVHFSHRTSDGRDVLLDMDDESGGTQKLFALAGPWLDVLANGWVLVIDELDTSLHPLLMRQLVGMFNDPVVNTKGAQLVFSTHDTSILDREIFRRDQVWFMEKDRRLQSHLYPLTDFSPRKEENFARGYLQGRYGALPFIGELKV